MSEITFFLNHIEENQQEGALCIITETHGSTPRKVGSKMLVFPNGKIIGSIGGGRLEKKVIEDAIGVLESGQARQFDHALVFDHEMCCGGRLSIYIEPMIPKKNLHIFGAGHIGKALAELAVELEFNVTVIDERSDLIKALDHPLIQKQNMSHKDAFKMLNFKEKDFVAVITHDHAYDREIIAHCGKFDLAYLGMIGSRRKVEFSKKIFREDNALTESQMDSIDWPMGLEIKAQTPKEIAISIMGKLIEVRASIEKGKKKVQQ
tara:strand:+ start:2582 stop:3370 length:789 start_codon:yes stop_codon:yes gene_type:complete